MRWWCECGGTSSTSRSGHHVSHIKTDIRGVHMCTLGYRVPCSKLFWFGRSNLSIPIRFGRSIISLGLFPVRGVSTHSSEEVSDVKSDWTVFCAFIVEGADSGRGCKVSVACHGSNRQTSWWTTAVRVKLEREKQKAGTIHLGGHCGKIGAWKEFKGDNFKMALKRFCTVIEHLRKAK